MENFIDGDDTYKRLKLECQCWHTQHCGHSCTDSECDCNECVCPACITETEK
jgi:hypothetical protein